MKKKFIAVFLLCLTIFSFGCNSGGGVTFGNKWNAGNAPSVLSSETIKYEVTYSDSYKQGDYNYTKTAGKSDVIDYVYGTGEYVVTLGVYNASKSLPCGDSEIIDDLLSKEDQLIYRLQTEFSIPVSFRISESDEYTSVTDIIKTDCFFLKNDSTFSPIYASGKNVSTLFYNGVKNTAARSAYSYKTVYNKTDYTVTMTELNAATDETVNVTENTYKYEVGKLVDNDSLLFVLRNSSLAANGSVSVATVAPAYGASQNLTAKYVSDTTGNFAIGCNGEQKSGESQLKVIALNMSSTQGCTSTYFTGKPQLIYLQKEADSVIGADKSIMMRYVEPLTVYGSYKILGALVFNVKEVKFN